MAGFESRQDPEAGVSAGQAAGLLFKCDPLWQRGLPALLTALVMVNGLSAADPIRIWPDLAPGEKTKLTGTLQPFRKNEKPPVSRVENITLPTMTFHPADKPNGAAVVILPGGGFAKVVPNKEGTEYSAILNRIGVAAFVLSYRTRGRGESEPWKKPLQDAQRAIAFVRAHAVDYQLKRDRIGLVGFSAGGNVAARLLCGGSRKTYPRIDAMDDQPHRPDFAMLVYPWNILDVKSGKLVDGVAVPADCPPTFLVHTHDDRSTSLGTVLFYVGLKQHRIPAALHVYSNGGHGYGTRPIPGSRISDWSSQSTGWLESFGWK